MEKREVSKRFMFHLIEKQNPVYRYLDEFGLIHLTGSEYDFVYAPYGLVSAKNNQIEYTCQESDFTVMYNGLISERGL